MNYMIFGILDFGNFPVITPTRLKGTLRDMPLNSLFLDTLQEVELFGFFNLSLVRL